MVLRTNSSESRAGRSSLVRAGKSSVLPVEALEKLAAWRREHARPMAPCRVEVLCMASQVVAVVAMEEDILIVWSWCVAGGLLVVV